MDQNPTLLDRAHAAMSRDGATDQDRLRYFVALADTELFLLLDDDAADGEPTPRTFELEDDGSVVLAFDSETRLTGFTSGPSRYAVLSGRALAALAAPQGIGLGVNLGTGHPEMLLPPDALAWLTRTLSAPPKTSEDTLRWVAAPSDMPDAALPLLAEIVAPWDKLATAAYLVHAGYQSGRETLLLAITGSDLAVRHAMAGAVSEAVALSAGAIPSIDVLFVGTDDPFTEQIMARGHAFAPVTTAPKAPNVPAPPGSDPQKPPILR